MGVPPLEAGADHYIEIDVSLCESIEADTLSGIVAAIIA